MSEESSSTELSDREPEAGPSRRMKESYSRMTSLFWITHTNVQNRIGKICEEIVGVCHECVLYTGWSFCGHSWRMYVEKREARISSNDTTFTWFGVWVMAWRGIVFYHCPQQISNNTTKLWVSQTEFGVSVINSIQQYAIFGHTKPLTNVIGSHYESLGSFPMRTGGL